MSLSSLIRRKKKRERTIVRSAEFRRIAELPRRDVYEDLIDAMTEWLKVPGGEQRLRLHQAWALAEFYEHHGLLGSLPVGSGKTIVSHLAPVVLQETEHGCERPLLLVKAALLDKAENDRTRLMQHWKHHPNLRILSYEKLSNVNYASYLFDVQPDCIINDEAQHTKNTSKGRGKRMRDYLTANPTTAVMNLTGSITRRSLKDYAKLTEWALKDKSPLPRSYYDLLDWADALDENVPDADRVSPGALLDFCENGEEPRLGYRRRFVQSPGIVTTEESAVDIALVIKERHLEVPPQIVAAFAKMVHDWETPGGETVSTVLDWVRHAKELSMGFYNRMVWPNGVADEEWLEARRNWRRLVHKIIKNSRTVTYDTELQVANAIRAGEIICPQNEYQIWHDIKDRSDPKTEAVWLSDFVIDEVMRWLENPARYDVVDAEERQDLRGIAWVEHVPVQQRLRDKGAKVFGAGENDIEEYLGSCVASIDAHGTGKDLQQFNRNLLVSVPESATDFEQCVGRTHRGGENKIGYEQTADPLIFDMFMHCRQQWWSLEKVKKQAEYIVKTTGQRQKIEIATLDIRTTERIVLQRSLANDPLWQDYHDGD